MFRYFENLIDPYQPYPPTDAPPRRLWPFVRDYSRPFRGVFAVYGFACALMLVLLPLIPRRRVGEPA